MPILGTVASSYLAISSVFESIATISVTSTSTVLTFSSIPTTYQHLQLRVYARTDYASNGRNGTMWFNQDSGGTTNYTDQYVFTNGASVFGSNDLNASNAYIPNLIGGTNTSDSYGNNVIYFMDYANTNKYKTVWGHMGEFNTFTGIRGTVWESTSAITRIDMGIESGGAAGYVPGTIMALYGIKA